MKVLKSKTNWGIVLTAAQSLPELTNPLWERVAAAGVSDPWLARMQVAAVLLTAALGLYGRFVAKGPLSQSGGKV
jgi:hypothetical protein